MKRYLIIFELFVKKLKLNWIYIFFKKSSKYSDISDNFKIQDDDDGHLIYVPGDVLKMRCEYFLFLFIYIFSKLNFIIWIDKVRKTLGEGTFGKVIEVKDSYE